MASKNTVKWVERLVWICLYSGLLSIVFSLFLARTDNEQAAVIQFAGIVLVGVGVLLIYVRSRLKEPPSA
jgi:uncharacterized membrane protein HdeD (DUF308 family)